MKTLKTIFFAFLLFLTANTVSAQYGNGYGGYGGYNGYGGYGRSNQIPQTQHESAPKPVPVEITAGKIVAYYKKELNLDALQEVVVNNIFVKTLKKQDVIMKKEISDDEKTEELKVLNDMAEMEVSQVLNKDQKQKYKNLIEDRKSKIEAQKR